MYTYNKNRAISIDRLESLIFTAIEAKEEERVLAMDRWVTYHTCGFAACLIGYQVLSKRLDSFPQAFDSKLEAGESVSITCDAMSIELEDCLGYNLAASIYESKNRASYAGDSGLFSEEEIDSFGHLSDDTDLDLAIEYMEAVIVKIKMK